MNIPIRFLEEVWNKENHAVLFELVPKEPLALLNLINLYKAFVPDLRFDATGQHWSAVGHHCGRALDIPPTGRAVRLEGSCDLADWDVANFCRLVRVPEARFNKMLCPAPGEIRLRSVWRAEGTAVLLFPALSLPGWITWRRSIEALQYLRPLLTFQLLANRWAIEKPELEEGYSVKTETAAVNAALRIAELDGALDVIGHSAGGTLALDFALTYPKQIHSLTLIEPGAAWVLRPYNDQIKAVIEERMAAYSGTITPERYASFLRRTLGPGYEPHESQFWPWLCLYRNNMRYRPALYEHVDDPLRLEAARFPVLLIRGQLSDYYHREIIRVLQTRLPNARTVELPGGHSPHQGQGHSLFIELLREFHRAARHGRLC